MPAAPALGVELIFSFFLDLLPMPPIDRRARELLANLKLPRTECKKDEKKPERMKARTENDREGGGGITMHAKR